MEEYWLKCGFKDDGSIICVRKVSESKPDKQLYYGENGNYKEARNVHVVKLTKEAIESLGD